MKKCAIYARTATRSQNNFGANIDYQIKQLRSMAARKNLLISDLILETESGVVSRRIKMGLLLAKIKRKEIQEVLITSWDRLSRNPSDLEYFKRLFKNNGVKVITL